ncbi:MAG: HAD hydrolase-like protein [Candidatus Brocadiales bacterium]
MPHTFKAVIFDLDDTLYDCSGTLVHSRRLRASKVIAGAIGCSEKEAYELQLDLDRQKAPDGDPYKAIARKHSLPESFLKDVNKAFSEVGISGIKPFAGVTDTLKDLKNKGLTLFLVTVGRHKEQEEKVQALGLEGLFDEIVILDAGEAGSEAKKTGFRDILDRHGLRPEEVLCVGDRMDRELKVAKELGIHTVMVKHGRHYERFISGSAVEEKPDMYIENVANLPGVLSR